MKKTPKRPPHISREDWDAVDIPEQTEDDYREMRPAKDVLPAAVKRSIGQRGPGRKPAKVAVSLRLDPEILAAYKATGEGWQSLINEHLKAVAGSAQAKRLKSVKKLRIVAAPAGAKGSAKRLVVAGAKKRAKRAASGASVKKPA